MAYFSPKRGRTARVQTLRPTGPLREMFEALQDRQTMFRLLLCALAVAAVVVSVQAWKLPFPYRLGQHPAHGIAARLDFERSNPVATERAREMKAAQVPYIFRHDPAPLRRLPAQLRGALRQVAEAKSLEDLSLETRTELGLVANQAPLGRGRPLTQAEVQERFQHIKAAVADENSLEVIESQFRALLQPIEKTGLLLSPPGPNVDIRQNDTLAIVDDRGHRELVMLAEIQLPQLLAPTGSLGESWHRFPALVDLRPELESWLLARAPETLTYDDKATQTAREEARSNVATVKEVYKKGNLLVNPGDVIDPEHLDLLRTEYEASEAMVTFAQRTLRVVTVAFMVLVLVVLNGFYLVRSEPALGRSASRLSVYLTVAVLAIAIGRTLSFDPWRAEVIPLATTVMVFAIAYNQILATLTGFSLSLIITLATGADLSHFVVLLAASTTAAIPLSRVSSRSTLISVGFWAGVVYFLMSWGTGIISSQSVRELVHDETLLVESIRGGGWCLAAGFLVAGSLPFIESIFGVVTNISLLEMGDVSHPLLQELVRRAPGTYNHSITVASISEAAADTIGANGLLCRVGAYFHDIGKMLKPQYFVENMTLGAESRHEHLAPAMSTLIIIGHVKDGVDLAEQHGLPRPLIDFIEQHHGTTLVEYFYHEATKQADQNPDHRLDVQESAFRYPGPKPQTKEAAVMMLADAVEGASRTLSEPTPKRIERLVHDLTMKRLLDGQFEESTLTMTEIHAIEQSLVKSLIGIYHGRIKYPEQRTA